MFNFNIAVETPKGRKLIAPFSYSVNMNDCIAVIGEEGNGKSVLLKSLFQHESIADLRITITVVPYTIVFGYCEQELTAPTRALTVFEYACSGDWEQYPLLWRYMNQYLPKLSEADIDRKLETFSGGEIVKLQLIKLMMADVDCYLLDEPTNNLDLKTLLWLERWVQEQQKPVFVVSHDVMFLRHVANRIVHLEQTHRKTKNHISVYEGGYDDYVQVRSQSIAVQNQQARSAAREHQKQHERWLRMYQQVEHKLSSNTRRDPAKGRLLKKKMKNVKAMGKRFERTQLPEKRDTEESIRLFFDDRVKVHEKTLIHHRLETLRIADRILGRNYDLMLKSRLKIACIGDNGVGKSVYFDALVSSCEQQGLHVGVMHQDYTKNLDMQQSALENLQETHSHEEQVRISQYLGNLKFTEDEMLMPMHESSGGQKAKVSLLKLVMKKPDLLLLDEPTRNLSPLSVAEIYRMLQDYSGAIFAITHDRAFIDAVFDQVVMFTQGGFIDVDFE